MYITQNPPTQKMGCCCYCTNYLNKGYYSQFATGYGLYRYSRRRY